MPQPTCRCNLNVQRVRFESGRARCDTCGLPLIDSSDCAGNPPWISPLRLGEAARRAIDTVHAAEARRAEAAERDPDQAACPECAEKDTEIARLQVEVERLGSAIEAWRESARGEDQ